MSDAKFTFIDLFAGAGGFSEGFLQATLGDARYEFLLASDINENCELTHRVRYNHQLGLPVEFLRKSITDEDFLDELLAKLHGRQVDVICGGPPCQSFSLAGRRRKHDKKDDLFARYLEVIAKLRPKYFVMENVPGLLTKEQGAMKQRILTEIASIIDDDMLPDVVSLARKIAAKLDDQHANEVRHIADRLAFEPLTGPARRDAEVAYIEGLSKLLRKTSAELLDYKTSKTDHDVLTVRHGLLLLREHQRLGKLRDEIVVLKSDCDLDNDYLVDGFDRFLTHIEVETIVDRVRKSLKVLGADAPAFNALARAVEVFVETPHELLERLGQLAKRTPYAEELERLSSDIRLYRTAGPRVLNASDYGVPQDRRRVVFIGCRRDQPLIKDVPPTVAPHEKVTVFEALHDLDFVGNDEEATRYEAIAPGSAAGRYNQKHRSLIRHRAADGRPISSGMTYADWSRKGRLVAFPSERPPTYVRSMAEYGDEATYVEAELQNHKVSNHNEKVEARLKLIQNAGEWTSELQAALERQGLGSDKRDYNVLKPDAQSPTMMTIADDYIHHRQPRALSVREMARLQSFDDSFVFQGKRTTGGDRRKVEVPQFTLVGNAVPPLLARAVAQLVLEAMLKAAQPESSGKKTSAANE